MGRIGIVYGPCEEVFVFQKHGQGLMQCAIPTWILGLQVYLPIGIWGFVGSILQDSEGTWFIEGLGIRMR